MSAPKTTVSVIVPVYNTKTFLNECLESLVHQTLPGIEIILIDDGSNDGSSEICKEYAEKNSFVKYFRQPNSGTVVARQRGLENVSGEYFSFCDSDDFVDPDFYKNLYDAAKAADADVAQCGYSLYFAADDIVRCPDAATARVIQRNEGSAAGIMDVLLLSPPLNVRRVHRTALLKKYDIAFDPAIRNSEDHLFSGEFFLVSNKVVSVDQTGYFYRQRRIGSMTYVSDERLMDFFLIMDKLREFMEKHQLDFSRELALLEINTLTYPILRMERKVKKSYCRELLKRITCRKILQYSLASWGYCRKMRLFKYYILSAMCCPLLLLIAVFRKIPFLALPLLEMVVFIRKGNFFRRLKGKSL